MLTNYMVIAVVNGVSYLVNIEAESLYQAEHKILDLSVCGKHTYGVTACTAFDAETMKTDTFVFFALYAKTISVDELFDIIDKRNEEIARKDEAEDRIKEIEDTMGELQKELEDMKKILES